MLKICRTILKGKYLWRALPVAVLSVFCCFLFSGNAKASTNEIYENLDPNSYPDTGILSGGNCWHHGFGYTPTESINLDGIDWVSGNSPLVGDLAIYIFDDITGLTDDTSIRNASSSALFYSGNLGAESAFATNEYIVDSGYYSNYRRFYHYDLIDPITLTGGTTYYIIMVSKGEVVKNATGATFGSCQLNTNYNNYYRIYGEIAGPTGSVYWAGVGTQALYKGEVNRIPFYYNICDDWETYKSYDDELWVQIKQGETDIASSSYVNFRVPLYDNSECKGFRYISMDSGLVNIAATGTMDIILRNDPATSTEKIYGQNTFFYNYQWRDGLTYFNRLFNSPLIIPQKTGTSTITFEYGFNELNVDRVCWFNEDWQVLNTDVCTSTDQIDNEGIGGLDLPNQITKTIYKGSFAAVDTSNNILLKTEPFQIVWANDWKDAFSEIGSSTDDSLLKLTGLSARDLACTQEEWAESAENWFNWQKLKCNSLYSLFFTGEVITNAIKSFIKTTSDIILTMFPLNIPTNIIRQWNLSEGKNLPAGLEMLTPQDENGNIYLTLSPELAGATTTVQIWGEEVYYATPGLESIFNFIKELSKILLWLLVLVEIVGIGFQIFNDINHEEEPDFELSSIHYDSKGQYSASYRPKK